MLSVVCLLASSVYAGSGSEISSREMASDNFPYQVSLQIAFGTSQNFSHFCSASIVNENYIVTLATCVEDLDTNEKYSVLAGTTNLNDVARGSMHLVESCLVHPNYNENTAESDIAVCRLQTPLIYGEHIAPIPLDRAPIGYGVNCTLSGWLDFPDLQSATKRTLDNNLCTRLLTRGVRIRKTMMCIFSQTPCVV